MSDTQTFELGQRVLFSDRLVRVSISNASGQPETLLREAFDLMRIPRARGSRTYTGLDWKMWVPSAFAREHLHKGLCMISSLDAPDANLGFIVQRVTLQQGGTLHGGWDNPPVWMDHGTTRAYKVAVSLNRKPVHVLSEHLREA